MTFCRGVSSVVVTVSVASLAVLYSQTAQGQVKLEYKFPEGNKLSYKTTSRARQVLTFMGMEIESIKRETREWSRSVGNWRGDSTLPVKEKVQLLRVDYTLPGGIKLSLDSTKPDIKIENAQLGFLGDVFKLESMIAYTVLLDKETKVKAIEGLGELREKIVLIKDPIAREELESEIGADRLKMRFEQELRSLPTVVVNTSEPWERIELLEVNGKTFTVRKKYEYRGTEKKGVEIVEKISGKVLEVKYDQDPQSKLPLKVVRNSLKVESSEETILFNREKGHVVSVSDRIRIKGEVGYSGAGVEQSGPFELNFDTNTQLQPTVK